MLLELIGWTIGTLLELIGWTRDVARTDMLDRDVVRKTEGTRD
jgi:hypothetical protein